jgi:hypothetical protein
MQELHDDGVEAAADRLWHLARNWSPNSPKSWRDQESIGRSEFGGLVQAVVSTYLETVANVRGSDKPLSVPMEPWLIVDLTLYPRDKSGQKSALRDRFGCLCKFDPGDVSGWDGFFFPGEQVIEPGETKRVSVCPPRAAPLFRLCPKFYLWSIGIIGEAAPVSGPHAEQPTM